MPKETQKDTGTIMVLDNLLPCLFTIVYLYVTNPETNGPTASLDWKLESHLGTFCSLLPFPYNDVSPTILVDFPKMCSIFIPRYKITDFSRSLKRDVAQHKFVNHTHSTSVLCTHHVSQCCGF